ncbi:MAG TPA: cupin domain-containing protein [Reyranella sp.]|jgi:mannose-6-phosphate isomerase-like protein (cupin superfamily)|nr:cupin domain-containing protein [Reyranella sp.]
MVHRIRRVVTGHDKNGKSVFIMDGKAPNVLEMASMPGVALTDLWRTKSSPASNSGNADAATGKIKLEPPSTGTILRIVEFPPDSKWRKSADASKAFASIDAGGAPDRASSDAMMHATATVDYIIVLKGEIYAILDKGEKLLKQGDVLIQRGTNHSWSVRGKEPAVVAAILVGANPVGRLSKRKKH